MKGGSQKNLKAPQLSSGSLIDCIRALYDKASSLKGAGFNLSPYVNSRSLFGPKTALIWVHLIPTDWD